jgi:hypothetical protein
MAVASPPPSEAAPGTPVTQPTAPPRQPSAPPPPAPRARGSAGGLILISIGLFILLGTWFPSNGGWLFVGLGLAFALARVLTGHPGYAVPASILLGFGAFVWTTETMLANSVGGGLFFVFLGLGFFASYVIAARPLAAWPILPGVLLIGFGAFIQATTLGVQFVQFWWLAQFWPITLLALGGWLLLRERIPDHLRGPIAVAGAAVLILIGLLVAAAGVASWATPYPRNVMPMPWPVMQMPFGNAPIQDSIDVSAPITSSTSLRVVNTSGSTTVRSTNASDVTVHATRHYWTNDQVPEVQLVPDAGILVVQVPPITFGRSPYTIDYVIDVPANLGADLHSASGSINVSGAHGPLYVETASGSIRITDVNADLTVNSSSGSIDVTGDFPAAAHITSVSGSVILRFAPSASAYIDASSLSGSVDAGGLRLKAQSSGPHSLTGTLAAGGPTTSVRTTSGSIRLSRGF